MPCGGNPKGHVVPTSAVSFAPPVSAIAMVCIGRLRTDTGSCDTLRGIIPTDPLCVENSVQPAMTSEQPSAIATPNPGPRSAKFTGETN
jgi:hypothetical protein